MAKKRTRKGVPNKERDQVLVIPSHCKKCGSTDREQYQGNISTRYISGSVGDFHFNRIVWKRTKCKKCGQHRTDRIYENK